MDEEQHWIRSTIEGDKESFANLVDKYKNKVFTILLGMGNNRNDAQDMAQEVFIKAYRHLRGYDPNRSFASWLYRIAVNHCRDEWKKRGRELWTQLEEDLLVDTGSPESVFLRKESTESVREMLGKLADPYRAVLMLRYSEELSYQEISDILGIPVSSIQVQLHRAKKKLKEQLERKGDLHELLFV